ncbi:DNA repair and recombination protein RAD54B-like [Saccostrea echinata]|uniref:DNA repair and recombination protein RAD54B-like n=1 Tax=Saccostrea echinata TaxID=191078 RepID=UPI002A81D6B4|nr:DNA repair and recombination protein RAD54B-like [Saccostrea echinata]
MRRSSAPSQGPQAKRPRFNVPFKSPCQIRNTVEKPPAASEFQNRDKVLTSRTSENTISPNERLQSKEKIQSVFKTNTASPVAQTTLENAVVPCRYFAVMWCKLSKKKHKKWEGDAVLVTQGRNVTLYDIEGKVIGKATGYKSVELEALKEDETLMIGGKEIQVMSIMTEEQFKSGKCFSSLTEASQVPTMPERPVVSAVEKTFVNPLKGGKPATTVSFSTTPRHDPTTPNALVLPRPTASHQWQYNKKNFPVVDVVVDPYLSVHLRPHQREGVTFLYECVMGFRNISGKGAILADDMGLGKTLQCISLLWTLYKQGPYGGKPTIRNALIITPGSLVKNWFQEIKKWLGTERLKAFAVSSDNKIEEFMNTSIYPIVIISYEMFVRVYEKLQSLQFDIIVCDEGHRLKNSSIKTTSLIASLPTQRRVVLSGTPIQNDLQEFYSIVEFCNPGLLGTSASFKRVFETPIVASRQPGASVEELDLGAKRGSELSRITKLFVLRRTQEINTKYLPPKCEIVLFCKPTDLQLRLYCQMLQGKLFRSCLGSDGASHLICIGALKKLCNHPSLIFTKACQAEECTEDLEEGSVYSGLSSLFPPGYQEDDCSAEHAGKLKVLSEILKQIHMNSEKIVVVSNHTKTLDILQQFCGKCGYGYLRLDGQTPTNIRQEIVTKFNSKHCVEKVFLLSSKAGGVGLNLVGASRLLLYDIDWNPANDLQAMARVWRDGQKRQIYIYRLLTTGTIEEKIYQRQISKQGLSGAVMDLKNKREAQFSLQELKDLFSLNENTLSDTHDLLKCECGGQKETTPETDPAQSSRSCQLGIPPIQKNKTLGMEELMDWKHISGNVLNKNTDWLLGDAPSSITFSFWQKINSEKSTTCTD